MLIYLARVNDDDMWNIEYTASCNSITKFIETLENLNFYLIPDDKIISYREHDGKCNVVPYDISFSENGEIETHANRYFQKIPEINSVKRSILLDATKNKARTVWYDPQYSFDDFISSIDCGLDVLHISDVYNYKVAEDHYAFYNSNGKEQGLPYNLFVAQWFNEDIYGNVLIFKATEYGDMLNMPNEELKYYTTPKAKKNRRLS